MVETVMTVGKVGVMIFASFLLWREFGYKKGTGRKDLRSNFGWSHGSEEYIGIDCARKDRTTKAMRKGNVYNLYLEKFNAEAPWKQRMKAELHLIE